MNAVPAGHARIIRMAEMLDPADGVRKVLVEYETASGVHVASAPLDQAHGRELGSAAARGDTVSIRSLAWLLQRR